MHTQLNRDWLDRASFRPIEPKQASHLRGLHIRTENRSSTATASLLAYTPADNLPCSGIARSMSGEEPHGWRDRSLALLLIHSKLGTPKTVGSGTTRSSHHCQPTSRSKDVHHWPQACHLSS